MALFEAEKCHVFRVPPTDSLKSELWEGNLIWSGSIRVFQDRIDLFDDSGVFGSCPLRDKDDGPTPIQPATDSRRCFVVRIEQGSQYAYLGIHFETREIAFQFSSAVLDRYRTAADRTETVDVHDRRLRQGETFSVDLANKIRTPVPSSGVATVGTRVADPLAAPAPAMPTNFNFQAGLQSRTGASRRVGATSGTASPPSAPAPTTDASAAAGGGLRTTTQPAHATQQSAAPPAPTQAPAPAPAPEFDPFAAPAPVQVMAAPGAPPRAAAGDFDPFAPGVFTSQPVAPVQQQYQQPAYVATQPPPTATTVKNPNSVDAWFS